MSTVLLGQVPIAYRNTSQQKPPRTIDECVHISADALLRAARNGTAMVWRGDFHQAKQVLAALKKRARVSPKHHEDPATAFHQHRLAQAQHSRLTNALLLHINADYTLDVPRAPNVQAALFDALGEPNGEDFLLPLNQLLGFLGAHEWHKTGVLIPALKTKIHVPFGVFSPLRGEYVDLVAQAACTLRAQSAMDIGTGSGILAAILAQHHIPHIIATDTNPRAIACAQANLQRLQLDKQVTVLQKDLFANECVDLIVCNPPWLPARPTSAIETALYDPEHLMLHAVLRNAAAHLNAGGQLWLIMSDLAVHLGLRGRDDLPTWFTQYGWRIAGSLHTQPQHRKAHDTQDTLAFARAKEITTLYRLERA